MAQCPLCDYTGSWRSVEGHISGSTDDDHRGEVGRHYRERIRATVGTDDQAEPVEVEVAEPPTSARPPETQIEGAGEGSLPPSWVLVGATVVLALLVVASISTSGGGAISDGRDGTDGSDGSDGSDGPGNELAGRFE